MKKTLLNLSLAAGFILLINSCDKQQNTASSPISTKPAPITWDWNKYAKATEMHLSAIPVDIQPKKSYDMKSEGSGTITFEINEKNTTVKKDQLIARMDVENLTEQEKRLQIAKESADIAQMKEDELVLPVKKKEAKEELEEARRKVKLLRLMLTNPATKEYANELFPEGIGNIDEKAMAEAEENLSLAEKSYAFAKDFEERLLTGKREIEKMKTTTYNIYYQNRA